MMATHYLDTSLDNLHGWFSRTTAPRLRIASGDTVVYATRESGWRERLPTDGGWRGASLMPMTSNK